jgi:hypothetical protein
VTDFDSHDDRPAVLDGTEWVLVERELVDPFREFGDVVPDTAYMCVEFYGDWEGMTKARDYEEYREGFIEGIHSVAERMAETDEIIDSDGAIRFYLSQPLNVFVTADHITAASDEVESEVDVEFVDDLPIDEDEKEQVQKEVLDIP